jgi:hypothetical protein
MSPDSFVIGGLSYDPGSGLAESSRGFFFRLCAGRQDNFFSNSSACRSALSALVRFFDMPTVSHRTDDLATTVDFKLYHYLRVPGLPYNFCPSRMLNRQQQRSIAGGEREGCTWFCGKRRWTLCASGKRFEALRSTIPLLSDDQPLDDDETSELQAPKFSATGTAGEKAGGDDSPSRLASRKPAL